MREVKVLMSVLLAGPLVWAEAAGREPSVPTDPDARRAMRRTEAVDLFEACRESAVTLTLTRVEKKPTTNPAGGEGKPKSITHTERGSGCFIHPDGYVLTVAHALKKGGNIRIYPHGAKARSGRVIGQDPVRDLALLKIDGDGPYKPMKLGRSDDLMVGEKVFALGNPFGFGMTLGRGIITGLGRNTKTDFTHLKGVIQTDAGINPGVSGGPLVNIFGELIGVGVSRKGEGDGLGFAMPVDTVRAVLPEMIDAEGKGGFVLGMTVDANDTAIVRKVAPDSPAEAGGVREGDVVTALGDKRIRSGVDFHLALLGKSAGEKLLLKLRRGRKNVKATVTLAATPAPTTQPAPKKP